MFQESAGKIFLRYAIPQMVGLLFNSIYVIVDGVFIGARLGSSAPGRRRSRRSRRGTAGCPEHGGHIRRRRSHLGPTCRV